MDPLSMVNVNWTAIITINLLTWFARTKLTRLKPYAAYVVLVLSALYAILVSLFSGIGLFEAIQDGFLHGAVASYVYSLWKRPSESKPARRIGDKVRGLINP